MDFVLPFLAFLPLPPGPPPSTPIFFIIFCISLNWVTSPDTWAETDRDVRYSGTPRFDPGQDFRGPVPFGVALEVAATDSTVRDGRVTIVGSSGFLTNSNILQYANKDLALNLVGWLAAEEDLLGIRGRRTSFQPLLLETGTKEWLGWISVLGWPGLVGVGWWLLLLWSGRRRRTQEV